MHFVYLLYSEKLDKFYIGETHNLELRLQQHNSNFYRNQYTKKGQPWVLKFSLECQSKTQAQQIEKHIKKMKSKKYIANFMKYSELRNKLLELYSN